MSPKDSNEADRRAVARHKVLKRAMVVFNTRNSVISGLVRNISETGAKFVVNSPVDLPHEVSLRFPTSEEWKAKVAWQKGGTEFGLRFVTTADR